MTKKTTKRPRKQTESRDQESSLENHNCANSEQTQAYLVRHF